MDSPSDMPTVSSAHFYLLGQVPFNQWLRIQRRLAFAAQTFRPAPLVVVLCEHPPMLTVGRAGSRRHVRCTAADLRRQGIAVQWVERGGGCILHNIGQLAVYPIAHLEHLGLTLGGWTRLLRDSIQRVLADLQIHGAPRHGHCGLAGRSGQLAAAGFAVRGGVCRFGAYLNVNPPLQPYRRIDVIDPETAREGEHTTMGSLVSESGRRVTMSSVRSALVHHLTAALGCEDRYEVSHSCPAPPRFA